VSAALSGGFHTVGVDAALNLDLEPTPIDAEITIYGSLDPDTEEAIANAREAARRLREEYGVDVIVAPSIVYWGSGHMFETTPAVYVNGRLLARGRPPTVEEIVEAVVALLGSEPREPGAPLPLGGGGDREAEAAAAVW